MITAPDETIKNKVDSIYASSFTERLSINHHNIIDVENLPNEFAYL